MRLLSVIIPTRNRAPPVLQIVGEVRRFCEEQSEWQAQVIIVDDGSTDDSVAVMRQTVQSDERMSVHVISNESPRGAAASRNQGIRAAQGEVVMFIDSDISLEYSAIVSLVSELEKGDIVFPKIVYETGGTLSPSNGFEEKYCMNSAVFLIRRHALQKMDMFFDEFLQIYGEDSDFFLRAKALRLKMIYCPGVEVRHPVRTSFSEDIFYQGVKNGIYVSLKLIGIVSYRIPWLFFLALHCGLSLFIAITRRHLHKLRPAAIPYPASRRRLLALYFRGMRAALQQWRSILQKRRGLRKRMASDASG